MKRLPSVLLMALGLCAVHRVTGMALPTRSVALRAAHAKTSMQPTEESGDDGDDDDDSGADDAQ